MSAPLFSQPSASKEELQNACSFVQSECNLHRRPYDMFSVLSGGLRPLYSGSSTESDLLTSINSLLSPPSPHDVSWNRQPGARYVPVAQEAFFKCGGLESLVASLRYPSAVNKPAICRCIAVAVGLQPTHISRAVELGVISSLADALSNTLKNGVIHSNCVSFAMAIEALVDSSPKLQNDADTAGLCVLIVNAILATLGGNWREVVHMYFWAVAAMCRGNDRVITSCARAGVPSVAVRALASCSKMLAAEAALNVLSIFTSPLESAAVLNSSGISLVHESSFVPASGHTKQAVSALLTSDEAVFRLAAFSRAASKRGKYENVQTALNIMLAAATADFDATKSVLERTSVTGSIDTSPAAVASSSSGLVQSCIASLMNDRFPQLCTHFLAKLVPISVFACDVLDRGGISVLLACFHSKCSISMLKCSLSALVVLATYNQKHFIVNLENMPWCEISVAIQALLQKMKETRENKRHRDFLAEAVRLLQILSSLPISFHFRTISFMLSSQAIEIVLCCAISSHACSDPERRGFILSSLQFVLTLMDFDLSIKPDRDVKTAPCKQSAKPVADFRIDADDYQSAASLVDVAPLIPDLLKLFASCISGVISASQFDTQGTTDVGEVLTSMNASNDEQRAITFCILKILTFLVDNPLAADVTGAAGGVELLVKLFLFGEEEHKAAVLVVLRRLHSHNDMNRQILARLIGKLPQATKSIGKLLLKDHQPWLRSPSKCGTVNQSVPSVIQGASTSSMATSFLPTAVKSNVSKVHYDGQTATIHSDSRTLRSHQVTTTSNALSASLPPYLLAPLSKIFENYSSSNRMSAKHLRKFCHDFVLKETFSRAIMRAYADISAASGEELSSIQFAEAVSAACAHLQLSPSHFLCEIGAKNARAVCMVVDTVRERSLVHQRLEQSKRAVCLHVDVWKDRQVAKVRISEQNPQYKLPPAQESVQQPLLKGRGTHYTLSKGNEVCQPPRSRSVQVQRKDTHHSVQHLHHRSLQPLRSRSSVDEASLLAEFGCMYSK